MRHGARVGSFLRGPDEVVMKVSSSALSDEQVEKLQHFVLCSRKKGFCPNFGQKVSLAGNAGSQRNVVTAPPHRN